MTTVTPDPKPASRHVASREEWDQIVLAKAGPCRGCGGQGESFHHLVPRSLRGDDVEANLVPVCGHGTAGCHGALENHVGGWEEIAHAVRHSLTPLELQYVAAKKGRGWLDRYYPAGDTTLCSRCRRPVRAVDRDAPRRRRRYSFKVPDDAENGAELLDSLIDAARLDLGREPDTPAYFVLCDVLHFFLTAGKERAA